jgi:hypothetical protein
MRNISAESALPAEHLARPSVAANEYAWRVADPRPPEQVIEETNLLNFGVSTQFRHRGTQRFTP